MTRELLSLRNVATFYGKSQALFGVSIDITSGESIALLGRNGMGKTTTVRSILGLTPCSGGEIFFAGERIDQHPPFRNARRGIGLVPEGRRIFPNLSVEENLVAASRGNDAKGAWDIHRVYDMFPRLKERRLNMGLQLSGGEQQMLAIGRALMTNPKLLILDEATEGLAPLVRLDIWKCLDVLRSLGQTTIIIDKNVDHLMTITDRVVMLEKGKSAWSGTSQAFKADPAILQRYLGV